METAHVVQYIDQWLSENSYRVDSRVVDFALDVRLMLESLEEPIIERVEEAVPA